MIARERNVIACLVAIALVVCLGFAQQAFASSGDLVAGSYENAQSAPAMDLSGGRVIDGGSSHAGIIKSDGSLWMWGKNDKGQVGNGTTDTVEEPVKVLDDVRYALVWGETSAAIKTDDSLWMWGSNNYGLVGDYTNVDRHEPVKVMEGVSSVYMGGSPATAGAVKTDGTFWIWGCNNSYWYGKTYSGLLGCGITEDWSGPVKVMDNVVTASVGTGRAVVTSEGELYMWGANWQGELGDGTYTCRDKPKLIMTDVKSVTCYVDVSCVIKNDGSLWLMGRQLTGSKTPKKIADDVASVRVGKMSTSYEITFVTTDGAAMRGASPIEIFPEGVASVLYKGYYYTLKADGKLWVTSNSSPLKAVVMSDVTSVGLLNESIIVSKSDGSFWKCSGIDAAFNMYSSSASFVSTEQIAQSAVADISMNASGPGTVSGPSRVFEGQCAAVSAVPDEHAEFRGWYVDGVLASTEPTCSIRVTSDASITGMFKTVYNLADAEIGKVADVPYTGSAIEPKPEVKVYGDTLVEGVDYRIEYERNCDVGEAALTITGIDADCRGRETRTFNIVAAVVSDVRISQSEYGYSGSPCTPDVVSVKAGSRELGQGDYAVEYVDNVNAGTARVVVRGTGNYGGTVTVEFAIRPVSLNGGKVVLSKSAYTYDGSSRRPAVKTVGGLKLVQGRDFKLSYKNNKKAGTATATVMGKGNYAGKSSATFVIRPMSLSKAVKKASLTYGKNVQFKGDRSKDVPVVSIPGLKRNRDFTVTSSNNKKLGKATAVIAGKGNYSGKLKRAFKLVVADGSLTSAQSPKYGTIAVRAVSNAATKTHQFIVCTAKSADSAVRNTTVSAQSCRFSSLQLGRTYYVAERAVAKVNGKTSYGAWSNWKAVKVENHAFVGSWDLVSYTYNGITYGPSEIDRARAAGYQSYLKVRGDYTMTLVMGNSASMFLWIPTSDKNGMLSEPNTNVKMSYGNGRLTIQTDGIKQVFERN